MSHENDNQSGGKGFPGETSAFPANILGELDAPAATGVECRGVSDIPSGAAVLVVKRGPNAGSRFLLQEPVTTAGRHPASDILLDDVSVSRRHAEFRRDGIEYRVVDLDSLNDTHVNGEPVAWAALAHGDEIQIGIFRLLFLNAPPSTV